MPGIAQAAYRGTQYTSYGQAKWSFRPIPGGTYLPGTVLQLCPTDTQVFPDEATAQAALTGTNLPLLCGVVDAAWPGFNASIGSPSYTAPSNLAGEYGTNYVEAVVKGYVPGIFVDQSGTAAVTLTNGLSLVTSRVSVGYAQGQSIVNSPGGSSVIACAALPAAGIGSSVTAASLTQATAAFTIASPAVGDTITTTIQSPYIATAPGTVQTISYTTPPLTSGQATTATTAAAAVVAYLNGIASFTQYFIASQSAGQVIVTVNSLATPFKVNTAGGVQSPTFAAEGSSWSISISGMVANSLTFGASATGSSSISGISANFAGGQGFKGLLPAWVCSTL